MSEFEDAELARMLGRVGGAYPDVNVAYQRLQGRVRRAQRRRVAVVGSATFGLLLAAGIAATHLSVRAPALQPSTRDSLISTLPDNTAASSTPNNSTGTSTDGTTDSAPPNSTPSTATGAVPVTRTFSGVGGTITVRLQNNTLTLVSHSATAGYSVDVQHSSGDRVEVRFESEDHETRIRVDLKNGQMMPEIDENES